MSTRNDNPTLGPTFTAHARQLANRQNAKSAWPYPWIYPPAAAVPVTLYGGVAMPADSDPQAIIPFANGTLSDGGYLVPNGFSFNLAALIFQASVAGALNSALAPGDGTLIWTLDVDQPLGQTFPSGAALKDFSAVTVPMGSWEFGWFRLFMPYTVEARHEIRAKILNVSNTTSDVYVSAGLFGYLLAEE